MKFLAILIAAFAAGVLAQDGCGFPDGPDCISLGDNDDGLEQFTDPEGVEAGCCLFPLRCGNGGGADAACVRV